jgi:dienelactone hydrolase
LALADFNPVKECKVEGSVVEVHKLMVLVVWCVIVPPVALSQEVASPDTKPGAKTADKADSSNPSAAPRRSSERNAEILKGLPELAVGAKFKSRDTINCGKENLADAAECLAGLTWEQADFEIQLQDGNAQDKYERLVRFPSPTPLGSETGDLVAMEWHLARDDDGHPIEAPAMVVVHESGSGMTVGRMIARGLRSHGMHTFMLQMPNYGVRRQSKEREVATFLPSLKQAIADVRRAKDAVAVLPFVDERTIGVQGTSLGGFVTATVSGLDAGFHRNFVLLAGGNLHEVIFQGQKDAAKVRQRLEQAGISKEVIMEHARQIEPLRLAHRVRPDATWLFSGQFDDVVPPACSHAFAKAAKLPSDHHIEMPVNHYSGVILLPKVLKDIAVLMGVPGN